MNGQPETLMGLEVEMRNIIDWITKAVTATHEAYTVKLAAEQAYRVAYARAYVTAAGPQTEKRYAADLATCEEANARDVADAAHRYAADKARALKDRLDAVRSINSTIRSAGGLS